MSNKYKFHNPDGCYFVTFAVVGWIDAYLAGQVFTRNQYKDILIESWKHCQKYNGLVIHAYVIMTNHVHINPSAASGQLGLENGLPNRWPPSINARLF